MQSNVSVTVLTVVYIYISVGVNSSDVVSSTACFGSHGLNCTRHSLTCGNSRIAIHNVVLQRRTFLGGRMCSVGFSNCDYDDRYKACCFKNVTGDTLTENTSVATQSVYRQCSHKHQCSYFHGKKIQPTATFSEIAYECIEDERTLDMCSTGEFELSNFTVVYNSTISTYRSCSCKIISTEQSLPVVHALDVRLGDAGYRDCSQLELASEAGVSSYNCSSRFVSYMELDTLQSSFSIQVKQTSHGDTFVWIGINGPSTFNVTCSREEELGHSDTGARASRNTGVVVAGVVAAVLVASVLEL